MSPKIAFICFDDNSEEDTKAKTKEVIHESQISSRRLPLRQYLKLLKTIRMPVVLLTRLSSTSTSAASSESGPQRADGEKGKRTRERKRMFGCDWPGCEYSSTYRRLILDHKNAHRGIRAHRCRHSHCDYSSSYFGDIRRHVNRWHKEIGEELRTNRKHKTTGSSGGREGREEAMKRVEQTIETVIADRDDDQMTTGREREGLERDGGRVLLFCDQSECHFNTKRLKALYLHKRRYHSDRRDDNNNSSGSGSGGGGGEWPELHADSSVGDQRLLEWRNDSNGEPEAAAAESWVTCWREVSLLGFDFMNRF